MIGGHPEEVLRHDVRATPHGKHRPRGELRTIDGDITGGIADAKDEDALSGKGFWGAVVVGMELLAGERAGAGEGWLGVPRLPVVAAGNQHGLVPPGARRAGVAVDDRDVPTAPSGRLGLGHRGPELYFPAESEMIHEIITVPRHHRMAQIVGIVTGHWEAFELHAAPGRICVK